MIRLVLPMCALLAFSSAARAEKCRDGDFVPKRLACLTHEADLHDELRQMVAVTLRLAFSAAQACGFVLDIDRFKTQLLAADLTFRNINDSSMYSPGDLRSIESDAEASIGATSNSEYCNKSWLQYGPEANVPDNVFYRCRSKTTCTPAP